MKNFGMKWRVKHSVSNQLRKDIKALKEEPLIAKKIKAKISQICINPFSSQLRIKKLQPKSHQKYRIKIDNWRIIFAIDSGNNIILIYRIAPRRNIYK